VGLPEAVDAALRAQFSMLQYVCQEANPPEILRSLAIFVASAERGSAAPPLALMIAKKLDRSPGLDQRLRELGRQLKNSKSLREAFDVAGDAYKSIGLQRGGFAWKTARRLLSSILGPRILSVDVVPRAGLSHIEDAIAQQHLSLLTNDDDAEPAAVQLMGLYQTKGREVDAAVVILRSSDWYGRENEPMPDGSKLLYVLMTRARKKTVVLALGNPMKPLVAPLLTLE
jgi:DNA helicase-2/ATP-dependent DNA helicase PcrA